VQKFDISVPARDDDLKDKKNPPMIAHRRVFISAANA